MADESQQYQPEITPEQELSFFQRYQRPFWIALIAVAVAVSALLTYLLFFRSSEEGPTYQGDVRLIVLAPRESASGSEISYKVTMENLSNAKLTGLALEIFYPRGFSFIDSTPDPPVPLDSARGSGGQGPPQFKFTDLKQKDRHELIIVGRLSGDVQEIKTFGVKLHYQPENFRSTFVAEASANTVILPPNLEFSVRAPHEIISGQALTYEIVVGNISEQDFEEIIIKAAYPPKFETNLGEEFRIPNLRVDEQHTQFISGRILEEPGRESLVTFEIFTRDDAGDLVSAGRAFAFTKILPPPLKLTQRILSAAEVIGVGEIVRYQIDYENTSEVGLRDVQIAVRFADLGFDVLRVESGVAQKQQNKVLWFPATNPELLVLNPGQKGSFVLQVEATDQINKTGRKNPVLETQVEFTASGLPGVIAGNTLELKVKTKFGLSVRAQTISPAHYRIDVVVAATVNDVSQALLTALVPSLGIGFDPNQVLPPSEAANVQFNPASGVLRWQIDKIFAFTEKKLSFNLGTLPTNFEIRGKDEFVDLEVSASVAQPQVD